MFICVITKDKWSTKERASSIRYKKTTTNKLVQGTNKPILQIPDYIKTYITCVWRRISEVQKIHHMGHHSINNTVNVICDTSDLLCRGNMSHTLLQLLCGYIQYTRGLVMVHLWSLPSWVVRVYILSPSNQVTVVISTHLLWKDTVCGKIALWSDMYTVCV